MFTRSHNFSSDGSVPPLRSAVSAWEWTNKELLFLLEFLGAYRLTPNGLELADRGSVYKLMALIRRASIVLWRDDLRVAAESGSELFLGTEFEPSLLRFTPQLWVYDVDIGINRLALGDKEISIKPWYCIGASLLAGPHDPTERSAGIASYDFLVPYSPDLPPKPTKDDLRPIAIGSFLGKGVKSDTVPGTARLMALLNFMNLEIVTTEATSLPRPFRRRLDRDRQPHPDIRIVALRKHRGESSSSRGGDIDWSCQWVVSGHWRNQWYPSKQEHYPVFVMPYIKGPEDKPLKASTPTVFDVRR